MIDWGLSVAILALAVTVVGGGTAWVLRFGKIEAAGEVAREAKQEVDALRVEVSEFKERIARDYATAAMVASVEGRVISAIDRLADRLDRILEPRATMRRTTTKD